MCGILSIFVGGLLGLIALFFAIHQLIAGDPEDPLPSCMILGTTAMLILSPALICIGIGQVRYRRWVIKGTLIWAAVAWTAAISFVLTMILEFRFEGSALVATALTWLPLLGFYPTMLLVLFSRRNVRASLFR